MVKLYFSITRLAERIEAISDRREQSNMAGSTAILVGLSLKQETIRTILRQEIMQESVIYQEIKAEGRAKAIQRERVSYYVY